ncbi:MAG: SUMF1/EgtB/PvdO family nonheme iron enzyme [Verrucomicrobiales bacterium]|nr:SUMF1/EgtB/PvdO family nonheme iron enzyme [Verrucomicrobiales bacterium]MCP5557169.1 SUMF1/EgtB/PvdO family nonheme iron enzyme [Verrucomicrobiaceae bacterium]
MTRRLALSLAFLSIGATAVAQTTPPAELKLNLGSGVTIDMMLIQPGSFVQGSPVTEVGREDDERERPVSLTKAYYMGKYPVTRGQFARFVAATRYRTEAEVGTSGGFGIEGGKLVQRKQFTWRNPGFAQTDDHPVVIVTADDAKAFCQWLSKQSRYDCQLPTEAQWEFACRAGTTTAHYLEPVDAVAWHRGNSNATTHPVGQKKPNGWGLHDLYGPVWQWCRDWYGLYPAGAATDPLQTNRNLSDKPRQVIRGGSFMSDVSHSRSAERYRNDAKSRNADNGFRIVCATTNRAVAPLLKAEAEEVTTTKTSPTQPHSPQPSKTSNPSHTKQPEKKGFGLFGMIAAIFASFVGYKFLRMFIGILSRPHPRIDASPMSGQEAAARFASSPPPLAQRFAFQMTDSGFYITGPAAAVGSRIQYSAKVGDRVLTDDITFSPGPQGQFIFTGARPSSVSVQTMGGVIGTSAAENWSSSFDDDPTERRRRSDSSSSRSSFPSAY